MIIDEVFAIQKDLEKLKETSKSYKHTYTVSCQKKQSQQKINKRLDFIYFKSTQRGSSMNC